MRGDARKRAQADTNWLEDVAETNLAAYQHTSEALGAALILLAEIRTLAIEWANADTRHHDDFLRGHAHGMVDAGEAILNRLGGDQ